MPSEQPVGCARPTGGPVGQPEAEIKVPPPTPNQGARPMIQIGKKAPDFAAPAFFNNEFTSVKLSDHLGKWVVLCFYPGDFTFV